MVSLTVLLAPKFTLNALSTDTLFNITDTGVEAAVGDAGADVSTFGAGGAPALAGYEYEYECGTGGAGTTTGVELTANPVVGKNVTEYLTSVMRSTSRPQDTDTCCSKGDLLFITAWAITKGLLFGQTM
jgi:hypothetical protein